MTTAINYNFINHIVKIKCIICGDFFEPDKIKEIKVVCCSCKEKKQTGRSVDEKIEKKRLYQKEYMKNYYRKKRSANV
jgi:hypothetical protein